MMTKEVSTQIVKFHDPWGRGSNVRHGHISHIVNMYYLLLYQYTAHWLLLCLGIMMLLSYTNYTMVDFHLFYDGAVDIQIWALLTRIQCKVSDTQVTVKACGALVCSCSLCIWFFAIDKASALVVFVFFREITVC